MQQSKQRNELKRDLHCVDNATTGSVGGTRPWSEEPLNTSLNVLGLHISADLVAAANTDISISQMHCCYQSSINATCVRFTRFDFGM